MSEHSPTPEDLDDWADARLDAELEVRFLREEWMFSSPQECDAIEKALIEAIRALEKVKREEAGE